MKTQENLGKPEYFEVLVRIGRSNIRRSVGPPPSRCATGRVLYNTLTLSQSGTYELHIAQHFPLIGLFMGKLYAKVS